MIIIMIKARLRTLFIQYEKGLTVKEDFNRRNPTAAFNRWISKWENTVII